MDNFASMALKDKRNVMHTSEQKRRREVIFSNIRKKFLRQAQQSEQDYEKTLYQMENFQVTQLQTREGRKCIKECLNYISGHQYQFQQHRSLVMAVAHRLIQLPINETTISIIYTTLQMMLSVEQLEIHIAVGDLWKLIGASLKYINQQHGYLLIKCCLYVLGNDCLNDRQHGIPLFSMLQYVNELFHTGDKGVLQETFWMLNNMLQTSAAIELVSNLDTEKFALVSVKFVERFQDENDLIKEILWLFVQITKNRPSENARLVAVETLQRITPQQDKQVLLAMMILAEWSSHGFKDSNLPAMLVHIYPNCSHYCQREILITLANLLVEDEICKQAFLASPAWKEVLQHSLKYYFNDGLMVLCNLLVASDQVLLFVRSQHDLISNIQPLLLSLNLSQPTMEILSSILY